MKKQKITPVIALCEFIFKLTLTTVFTIIIAPHVFGKQFNMEVVANSLILNLIIWMVVSVTLLMYHHNKSCVSVILCLIGFYSLTSCNQTPPKQFCSELSQECELQKDFVMIKILRNNGNGVDAYGTPLLTNEWYLHSTKSGAVLPLEWNGMESSNVTPPELEKVLSGEKSYSTLYKIKKYKVDTLENFGLRQRGGGGIAQVITKAILLETDGYFEVFNNGKGKYVGFRSQKETAENPVTE